VSNYLFYKKTQKKEDAVPKSYLFFKKCNIKKRYSSKSPSNEYLFFFKTYNSDEYPQISLKQSRPPG